MRALQDQIQELEAQIEELKVEKEEEIQKVTNEYLEKNGLLRKEKGTLQKELAALEVDVVALKGLREHITSLTLELNKSKGQLKAEGQLVGTINEKLDIVKRELDEKNQEIGETEFKD